jgi:hypothetical protein
LFSSPNKNLVIAFAISVFPTPVGPTKNKVPFGFVCNSELAIPDNPSAALLMTLTTLSTT